MGSRERTRPAEPDSRQAAPGSTADVRLQDFRVAGQELAAAADEAIRRALSDDSEAFLLASRQQGGQ